MYKTLGKPVIDTTVAVALAIVLSPVILLVCLAILIDDGRPVIFRQQRVGANSKPFHILKFRSMPVGTANVPRADAAKLTVTRIGKFLRRSNLDELPQLWNVIRQDMSLIGPRPGLATQLEQIKLRQQNGADALRPGVTGWAQVNSFDGMSETQKATLDGEYANKISLWMDIKILFLTVRYVITPPPKY